MKRTLFMVTMAWLVGIVVGLIGGQILGAQQEPIKRTVRLKTDLAGIEGREGHVVMVEIAPGAESGKHYHPGHEFGYILEGSGTFEVEGKGPVAAKKGSTVYFPPKQVHNLKNTSKTAPVKAVAFAIVVKGEPGSVPVK